MEKKKNLKAIDIVNEALKVFAKNPSFIFFTALISLPLFLFIIYFHTLFQSFVLQSLQSLPAKHSKTNHGSKSSWSPVPMRIEHETYYGSIWSIPIDMFRNLSNDQSHKILHLGFLYLAPLNLLQLATLVLIVDLGSKLYREDRTLTFEDMLGIIRFTKEKFQASFVTFLYVVEFSTCTLFGFIWLVMSYSSVISARSFPYGIELYYYSYIRHFETDIVFHLQYGFNLLMLSGIYLCWSSIWNLGLVVSVIEGKCGTKALGSSGYLCLRNVKNGMVLMFIFSIWEMGFWVPSFFSYGGYKTWVVIVVQSCWFCLGNAVKWVGFVVYFENCIKRLFVKKTDVEEG